MPDWDATRYHRLSDPQVNWGRKVLARLAPQPGERILDIGCGTGRLTQELVSAGADVVGVDVSAAMLREALATRSGTRPRYVRADGGALPFLESFDAVFSAATFHWIPDHERLVENLYAVLKPGGRLVAQAGGGPNLRRLLDRAHRLMNGEGYREFFPGWTDPWHFAWPQETRARLDRTGFVDVDVWLEAAPTELEDVTTFSDFISCVCVRHHVDKLPPAQRAAFVGELAYQASGDDPPFTLDYWRLNIDARKAAA